MKPAEFADMFLACRSGRAWAVANCATMDDVWATARPAWLVWIATRYGVLDDRTLRLFAVWCARQVQHLMTDPRSIAALDMAERHANGQATDEELAAARSAALGAARANAQATAWDAAWVAAWATDSAAWNAAWGAAWDGAWTVAAAEDTAARDAQAAWLRANAKPDWERVWKIGGSR